MCAFGIDELRSKCKNHRKSIDDEVFQSMFLRSESLALGASATLAPVVEELHEQRHHYWEAGRIGPVQPDLGGRDPVQ